jgi:hypothetical protein
VTIELTAKPMVASGPTGVSQPRTRCTASGLEHQPLARRTQPFGVSRAVKCESPVSVPLGSQKKPPCGGSLEIGGEPSGTRTENRLIKRSRVGCLGLAPDDSRNLEAASGHAVSSAERVPFPPVWLSICLSDCRTGNRHRARAREHAGPIRQLVGAVKYG